LEIKNISTLSEKWVEQKRTIRNSYFEHVNPRLGRLREKTTDFSFFKRLVSPDNFFMWFGIAAGITGLLLLLDAGLYWYWQLLLILAIVFFAPMLARFVKSLFGSVDSVLTVYPGKHHIGKKITLKKIIKDGVGEVVLHGETWAVHGENLSAETRVKVVAVKKNILYVVNAMGSFDEN